MKKIVLKGLLLIASIAAVFALLSIPDYIKLFHVSEITDSTEKKIGTLLWETMERTGHVITNDSVTKPVNKIIARISERNHIDPKSIKIHIIEKSEVNAFAMPDHHLILYTGLIDACDDESELAGVISHELAHIEKNHVMKKLVKEFGLSVLISMASGGRGTTMIREIARMLSSSAYDRKLESEADITGADYMINGQMNPEKLADFLYMLADAQLPDGVYWISTHPESKERAAAIIDYLKNKKWENKPVLAADEWKSLKFATGKALTNSTVFP